jgi:hypothetical protein
VKLRLKAAYYALRGWGVVCNVHVFAPGGPNGVLVGRHVGGGGVKDDHLIIFGNYNNTGMPWRRV